MKPISHVRAEQLIWRLLNRGPADGQTLAREFGWSTPQLEQALRVARNELCPEVGAVIPRPVYDDGYLYHLLDADNPNFDVWERGAAVSIADMKSRVQSVNRDASTMMNSRIVDGRTSDGRVVRVVEKMTRRILEDIDEL